MAKHFVASRQADPIEGIEDIRFRTGDWTYSAPIDLMVGRPIFGYGQPSWHPFVAASKELLADIDAPYETSVLRRFYDSFTPKTIAEAHFLKAPSPLDRVPTRSLFEPWMLFPAPFSDPFGQHFPSGSPLFGPLNMGDGRAQWRRLRASVKSILEYGYRPELFPRGRINVSVLRSRGSERYLVGHGQHRVAVLAAMGMKRIRVGIHANVPSVIDESEVHLWPHVRSGFLGAEIAVAELRRYFCLGEDDPALKIRAACE